MATIYNNNLNPFNAPEVLKRSFSGSVIPDTIRPNGLIEASAGKRLKLSEVADPEVTEAEFNCVLDIAESIENWIQKKQTFSEYRKNIDTIFELCNQDLKSKIFVGIITSGRPPIEMSLYEVHGIESYYNMVILLKKNGVWHIVDPLGAPSIAMKAMDWMTAGFDAREMERKLVHGPSDSKLDIFRMRVIGEKNTTLYPGDCEESRSSEDIEYRPTDLEEPGTGKNMLNLSDMIRLFNGEVSLSGLSMLSERKTPLQIANEIDLNIVASIFGTSVPLPPDSAPSTAGRLQEAEPQIHQHEIFPFMMSDVLGKDPTLSEAEFNHVVAVAELVRKKMIENEETFVLCCETTHEIFRHCGQSLKNKIFGAIITSGSKSDKFTNYPIHGINFLYHCIILLKKENTWYIVDPLMGAKVPEEDELSILNRDTFGYLHTQPVVMTATNWIFTAFDAETVQENLDQNRTHLYKMRILGEKKITAFTDPIYDVHSDDPSDYRAQEARPIKLTKPGTGRNMLNLSDMIKLFNGQALLSELSVKSAPKAALEIAEEVDLSLVNSTFKTP